MPGIFVRQALQHLPPVRPLLPQDFRPVHVFRVPDHDRPALAHGEVLRLVEAEAPEIPQCAALPSLVGTPDALRRILDHNQPVLFRNRVDRVHLRGNPGIIDGIDRLRLLRNQAFDQVLIQVQRIRPHVAEYRLCPPQHEGVCCRGERERGHDHLVPRLNLRQDRRHLQGSRAARGQQSLLNPKQGLQLPVYFGGIGPVSRKVPASQSVAYIFNLFFRNRGPVEWYHGTPPNLKNQSAR